MRFTDSLATAWRAIRSHTLRSMLTVLGILIGIGGVIISVGLGLGTQKDVSAEISSLGSNLLIVSPGSSTTTTGTRGGFGTASTLTLSDAEALGSPVAAPDVEAVTPEKTNSLSLETKDANWTTQVSATTQTWPEVRSREVETGRFFTESDVASSARVVVLGPETASQLFGTVRVVGQEIGIEGVDFEIIGVLAEAGASSAGNLDDIALIPISTAGTTVMGGDTATSVSTIYVKAISDANLPAAHQEVAQLLTNLHGFSNSDDADFSIASQDALVDTATSVQKTMTILLSGVAALSLLVGGIGVMNIMLVSVSERTREIGLQKALGAPPGVIRRQFLLEAAILGLTGGVLGVALGLLAVWLLPGVIGNSMVASAPVTVLSLIVAVGIGVIFGVYPATRAARLAPIDALRGE